MDCATSPAGDAAVVATVLTVPEVVVENERVATSHPAAAVPTVGSTMELPVVKPAHEPTDELQDGLRLFNTPTALPLHWTEEDDDDSEWIYVEIYKGIIPSERALKSKGCVGLATQFRHCGKVRLVWYNERIEENISPSQLELLIEHRY